MDKKKRDVEYTNACSKEVILCGLALLVIVAGSMFLISCAAYEQMNDYLGVKDDNVIEEAIEDIINHEIGLDIDLTPRSAE